MASPDPQGGDMGVKFFSSPFPPQNSRVKAPKSCHIMSVFVAATNPENLVKVLGPVFLLAYFLYAISIQEYVVVNILENGVNIPVSYTHLTLPTNREV